MDSEDEQERKGEMPGIRRTGTGTVFEFLVVLNGMWLVPFNQSINPSINHRCLVRIT